MRQRPLFGCTRPCGNCPYRKDSPVRHWAREEFEKVLAGEEGVLGAVFKCHKNHGGVCVGFLLDQIKRDFPSIMLRLELSRHDVTREYLDSVRAMTPMYVSPRAMIRANFPSILRGRPARKPEDFFLRTESEDK